jgi:hypothetical protein
MAGDPNFAKYMANRDYYGMHKVEGAWFSAHGEPGVRWAKAQRARDKEAKAAGAGGPAKPAEPAAQAVPLPPMTERYSHTSLGGEGSETGGPDKTGNAGLKRVYVGGGDSGGAAKLFDSQTGEYIPGTGAGFGAESRRPSWDAFRQSGNIEDRRGDAPYRSRGASRNALANKIGMPWYARGSEYIANNPLKTTNEMGRSLGTDDLDAQLSKPVSLKMNVNDNDVQFARTSMRRSADREVREARWNSYSDIGAA